MAIPRKMRRAAPVFLIVLALLAAAWGCLIARKTRRVCFGEACVTAEIASTRTARQKGLMFRSSLPADRGMLFLFSEDGRWGIWMKNMRIPLDVIWLGEDRRVVDMVEDLKPFAPPPGLTVEPPVFQSVVPSRFILEVNAGFVRREGVKIGDQARFE